MDCALMLQELTHMGVENIITFDAHDPRVQNAIPLTGFENVMPTYQVLKALLRTHKDLKLDKEHMMIISPDEGAITRNIYYSTVLGLDLGMFYPAGSMEYPDSVYENVRELWLAGKNAE